MIFRATSVLSFAVGGSAALAGIAAASVNAQQPLWIAAVAGFALAVVSTLVIDFAVIRPVQAREIGHFGTVMALAACLFVLIQLTGQAFTQGAVIGTPIVDGTLTLLGQTVTEHSALTLVLAVLMTGALAVWLRVARSGRILSALGDNAHAALMLALPVTRVRVIAIALAGLIAGVAGVLDVGRAPMTFQTGFDLSLIGFLAVVIGGTASAWGPLVGGIFLGLLESMGARVIGAQWKDYLFLVVILIAFRVRPQGLFATAVRHWD